MEIRANDIGFYAVVLAAVVMTAAVSYLPFYFVRRVPPRRWLWLPVIHGAWFGLISICLYYLVFIGAVFGTTSLLFSLTYLAAKRRITWLQAAGGVLIQGIVTFCVVLGITVLFFRHLGAI